MECQDWWDKNCIYLSPVAREGFLKAYLAANEHAGFLAVHADSKLISSTWQVVKNAGELIVNGVNLPSINEMEMNQVKKLKKKPKKIQ